MYVLMNALIKITVDPNLIFCFDKSIKAFYKNRVPLRFTKQVELKFTF